MASISLCAANPPFASAGTMPCAIAVMKGSSWKDLALARSFVPAFCAAISTARRPDVAVVELVDDAHRLGLLRRLELALEHVVERDLRADQARQALRASGSGDQAQLDLGEA